MPIERIYSNFNGTGWDDQGASSTFTWDLAAAGAQVGDLAIAAWERDRNLGQAINYPAGWTRIPTLTTPQLHDVGYRFLTSTASVSFTWGAGDHDNSRWWALYRGVKYERLDMVGTTGTGLSAWPTVVPNRPGLYVGTFGTGNNSAGPSAGSGTTRIHYSNPVQWEANMGIYEKATAAGAASGPTLAGGWGAAAAFVTLFLREGTPWDAGLTTPSPMVMA